VLIFHAHVAVEFELYFFKFFYCHTLPTFDVVQIF
jgi:hypothetical protein